MILLNTFLQIRYDTIQNSDEIVWDIVALQGSRVKHDGAATRTFQDNYVNNMVTNALVPHITRSSAVIVSTMQDKWILKFPENEFSI